MVVKAERAGEECLALLAVWRGAVEATHDFLSEGEIDALVPEVLEGLKGIEHLVIWQEAGSAQPLGFAGVQDGKLEMLFVDAAARGKGVGKCLLQHAIRELGARELDVNEQNPQALGFYERMGFMVTGRTPLDGQGRPYPLVQMRYDG